MFEQSISYVDIRFSSIYSTADKEKKFKMDRTMNGQSDIVLKLSG